MNTLYVPILKAKRGEFSALQNLPSHVANRIIPLMDLPCPDAKYVGTLQDYVAKTVRNCGAAWSNKPAFVDITKWRPNARVESGMHVLEHALSQLVNNGVLVRPVVGYDRWDDAEYSQSLRSASASHANEFCLRLDAEAIEDMGDPEYFEERLEDISSTLGLRPDNCHILIDLGDLTKASVPDVLTDTDFAVTYLKRLGYSRIVVAGGSMPALVNEAVGKPDQVGTVHRIEMLVWKAVWRAGSDNDAIYGDYGIRNPNAMDGIISRHNNGKIRYTISNQFFILRGRSKQLERLGLQQKALSRLLTGSTHYMGPTFSWGDSRVMVISDPASACMGAPADWIGFDTNHHIHAVVAEIFEHQTQVTAATRADNLNTKSGVDR